MASKLANQLAVRSIELIDHLIITPGEDSTAVGTEFDARETTISARMDP